MRRPAALLLLVVAGAAWPIGASPDPAKPSAARSKPSPVRAPPRYPSVDEALALAPPSPRAASRTPSPPRSRATAPALAVDDSCRASCAQNYYFCAAGEPGDCGGAFSQCSAACDAPNLTSGVPDLAR